MAIRIGISVVTHQGQNIWQNGLGQNVIFLADALQKLPFVENVLLIDVGDQNALPPQVDASAKELRIVRMSDATDQVDVVFEMGGALDTQWLDLMRARGKKVVYYCCGQPYVGLVEAPVFDKPVHVMRPDRYDEIWLMSKDRLSVPMMRTLHRCDVHLVPFIWHPQFLQKRIAEVAEHGLHYGYQPRTEGSLDATARKQGFRVSIFEPNISVVKTSSIAMLACEEAYRADPSSVSHMHVLNTLHMKDHPTLVQMANSLNLVKDSKATFHGRNDIAGFMAQFSDAVVSHQWGNDQNYLYLDVLYGGYPLVHNSPWLDAGYYYPGFDAQEAGRQVLRASREHDTSLTEYRGRAQRVIDSVKVAASVRRQRGKTRRMNKQTKSRMPDRLNVGVSIFIRKGEQSLWENGIFQNCLYLVMLLKRSPRVKSTYLVTGGGDGGPEDAKRFLVDAPVPLIDMETAMTKLDVMIEMSAVIQAIDEHDQRFVQYREAQRSAISRFLPDDPRLVESYSALLDSLMQKAAR